MSGHRQAALALYGLTAQDQDAILAELPPQDQQVLRTYLAELAELGFDGGAVPPAMPDSQGAAASPASAAEQVRRASAQALFEAVGSEPASLIAALLAIDTWPWAAGLLDLLAAPQRTQVRAALDRGATGATERSAHLRDAFLLDAVAAALAQTRARPAALAPARSPLSAFIARVSPWAK